MKWTRDIPTEQGWYWVRGIDRMPDEFCECEFVMDEEHDNALIAFLDCTSVHMGFNLEAIPHFRVAGKEDEIETSAFDGCLFYGPLHLPAVTS